jgi:general L-amino acid transport system permease protein
MSLSAQADVSEFRLSMLINDKRYRSYTFQFLALMVLICLMAFLGWNLMQNLAAAGLNISYSFLGEPAGYDINQRLIEYNSQSTHWRASVVGVLNTLLVAFLGCLMATIFGVFAGILRLSNNWIVAKIMAVYVEIFRNVPVLIWILIINAVFLAALPQPRAFRGENPEATMLFDAFAFTGRGIYMPKPVLYDGGWMVIVAFILSLIAVLFYRRYARKTLFDHGLILPVLWPSLAILFVPTLAMFFLLGSPIGLEYPALKGFNFKGGIWARGSLLSLWFALSIYTGAFIAENVRAGIQAVSKGQSEAAASLGLRPGRIMNLGDLAASSARDHSTVDFKLFEPNQKLFAGDCGRVYGCHGNTGWYYVEPNRARHRNNFTINGVLFDDLAGYFSDYECL